MAKRPCGPQACATNRRSPLAILRGVSEGALKPDEDHAGPPLTGVLVTLAGVAVLAVIVLLVEPLRSGVSEAVSGDTEALREDLRDLGVGGALIVYALALVHAFVWYPAEILDVAAGYVYDFWVALPLVMSAWIMNAFVAYWIGKHAARPLLLRFFRRERFERYERMILRGGVTLLLAMRLVPIVPFSLFSYVAGSARVRVWTFFWTTAVGYLPITAVFIYLGNRLEEPSITDPVLWLGAAILIALLLLTRRAARMFEHDRSSPERERA
jgi:uncharacterized membrane protein YdjX (TVP38/TMEM64 family)